MGGWRMTAVVAAAALAMPATAVPSTAQQPSPPGPTPHVPCPVAELDPPPDNPEQPEPPAHEPGDRQVGGAALASDGLVVPADAPEPPGSLSATSWLVADLDDGTVLGACGPHEHGMPASTLKLLLAETLLGELDPDRTVTVTRDDLDFDPGSSAVGLLDGGEYPVETLWLGLLLNSGNDAANVLARVAGGRQGVEGTLAAMNAEARRLGALQTHATTPSGLDGPGQFTSAYDLALIARALFDREDFLRYVQTERTEIPAQPHLDAEGFQIQNQNRLLHNYEGALGGKTGYTQLARHAFVGAAERGDDRLVVTLLGAESRPVRSWRQAAALLDWGFALPFDAEVGRLVEPGELAGIAASATSSGAAPGSTAAVADPAAQEATGLSAGLIVVGATAGAVALVALALLALGYLRRG